MDDQNRHLSEEEILSLTNSSMHKTFGQLGLSSLNSKNKGGLGGFIEENVFKYKANTDDNPDFIDAGIELKVTPVKKNNDGSFSSKERLVLNMINYREEGLATFKTSSFYKKNKKLLIWFYLYSKGINPSDFEITNFNLFKFEDSVQYKVIERDWNIIHNKIIKGQAHLISESDTELLSACTKGADSSKLTDQYHSIIKAKPRAYSFKQSFMTHMYREIMHQISSYASFISEEEWMNNPLEEIYKEKLSVYHGFTQNELARKFGIKPGAKAINHMIAQRMLGSKTKKGTPEMQMAGITFRTITVDKNGRPTEGFPFSHFEFEELINTPWEESYIREDFVDLKLLLFIFVEDKGAITFDKVVFWNLSNEIVDGPVKQMHEYCADLVRNGNAFCFDKKGKVIDKFPKENRNSNGICHVRPHARDSRDVYTLPVKDKETGIVVFPKQSFWFNKDFIEKIIKNCSN